MKRVGGTGRVLKALAAAKGTAARAPASPVAAPKPAQKTLLLLNEEEEDPYAFRPTGFLTTGIPAVFSRKKPAGAAGERVAGSSAAEKPPPAALGANQQHATLKKRVFRRSGAQQQASAAAQAPRPRPAAPLQSEPLPASTAVDEQEMKEIEPPEDEKEQHEEVYNFEEDYSSASEPENKLRSGEKMKGNSSTAAAPHASPGSTSDWDPTSDDSASSGEEKLVRKAAVHEKTAALATTAKKAQMPPTFRVLEAPVPMRDAAEAATAALAARSPAPKAKSARMATASKTATLEVTLPSKLFKSSADTVVLMEMPPGVGLVGAAGVVGRFTRNAGADAGRSSSLKAAAAAPIMDLMGVMYETEHVSLPGTAMLARAAGSEMVVETVAQSALRAVALPGQERMDESAFWTGFAADDEYCSGEDAGAGPAGQKGQKKRAAAGAAGKKAGGAKKAKTAPAAKAKPAARKKKASK